MRTARIFTLLTLAFIIFYEFALSQTNSKTDNTSKMEEAKAGIVRILNDKVEILDKRTQLTGEPRELKVMNDRIEFNIKKESIVIYYNDFIDEYLAGPGYRKAKIVMSLGKFEFITNGWVTSNLKRLEQLRQYLIFMQNQMKKKRYESQLILFEPIAAKYRELNVKPAVREDQRKYIVQANAAREQKDYVKALELFGEAIKLDQTAYPDAYLNAALIRALINDFQFAIYDMKKYLMLVPEAEDARAAQDKIYEWEAQIAN
jgi:tetratricopeptide (TPR) repeat protein